MIRVIFSAGFVAITVLFVGSALALIAFAAIELWNGINPIAELEVRERFNAILESVGLLTIAVAALELGQTILEEEVQRQAHISAPTRVRRFLSRFMIVIIVSLAIETLIAVFQFTHEDPTLLPHAATIGIAAGVLLAAWGLFIWLNRSAEELEPEAMEEAKREDDEIDRANKN
jgi:hypothetical protein